MKPDDEYYHDFLVADCGTVFFVHALTERGKEWASDNLIDPESVFGYRREIAVERRYIGDILEGIKADGLTFCT